MTELVPVTAAPQGVDFHRPDLQQWAQNLEAAHRIGSALCSTSFAPAHFRGKPDEAAAAILYGSEVGFTPTQALQNLYVIGGKPALYARPMVAIVQARGHKVWTEDKTDDSVTVCGQRKGSDVIERETWTYARAQKAGYTTNKKYQTDPQAMLYARAASDVCRRVAADALAGMVYSVEELELNVDPAPAVTVRTPGVAGLRAAVTSAPPEPPNATNDNIEDADEVTDEPETGEAMKPRTRGHLFALFNEQGWEREQQIAWLSEGLGRQITSRSELTESDAQTAVKVLKGMRPLAEAPDA